MTMTMAMTKTMMTMTMSLTRTMTMTMTMTSCQYYFIFKPFDHQKKSIERYNVVKSKIICVGVSDPDPGA